MMVMDAKQSRVGAQRLEPRTQNLVLKQKVFLSKAEVLEGTGWTGYFLKELEAAGVLVPLRLKARSQRRYRRSEVVKVKGGE